ncbi:MAG: hypothetical protein AAGI44_07020 [Pseudomonadota bacterium]
MSLPIPPLLHIGYPKGASTWLQQHFFNAAQGFGQVSNALVLHRDLVLPTLSGGELAAFGAQLQEAFSEHRQAGRTPVLSSEALVGDLIRGGRDGESIADKLGTVLDCEARVLIVVREQQDHMRSLYKTLVMFGADQSLKRLLRNARADKAGQFSLEFLCFDRVASLYERIFGTGAVCVLPFELFRQEPRYFLSLVRRHSGLPELSDHEFAALRLSDVANPGQSLALLYGQRVLNRVLGTSQNNYEGRFGSNHFDRVMSRIARHKRLDFMLPWDDWLEQRFRRTVNSVFTGRFERSNRALQRFCPTDLGALGYAL